MHSDDFRRAVQALAAAEILTWPQAYKAAEDYQQQRAGIEREAEERGKRYTEPKLFTRLMLAEDPVLGFPVVFIVAIMAFVLIELL